MPNTSRKLSSPALVDWPVGGELVVGQRDERLRGSRSAWPRRRRRPRPAGCTAPSRRPDRRRAAPPRAPPRPSSCARRLARRRRSRPPPAPAAARASGSAGATAWPPRAARAAAPRAAAMAAPERGDAAAASAPAPKHRLRTRAAILPPASRRRSISNRGVPSIGLAPNGRRRASARPSVRKRRLSRGSSRTAGRAHSRPCAGRRSPPADRRGSSRRPAARPPGSAPAP